jgi:DNA-binding NarL/FixJ family response regulator
VPELLVTGATNKVVAGRLFISEKTVSVHVSNLPAKLGVAKRGEAGAWLGAPLPTEADGRI